MAGNVIDSLVVTLGLDSKAFSEGVKGSSAQLADFTKRLAGMFLAIRGLEDLVGHFKDLHKELAQIGFTSRNLGVAGTELKRLGEVSELFGGQVTDAADSIQNLQSAVFNLRYNGQVAESLIMLQRFGVAYLDAAGHARNFKAVALDAAKVIDRQAKIAGLTGGERTQMALGMGFTGGIASAVAQGAKSFEENFRRAQKDQAPLGERTIRSQVELARDLVSTGEYTKALNSNILQELTPAIRALIAEARVLAGQLIPKLTRALEAIIKFFQHPPAWLKSLEEGLKALSHALGPTGSLIAAIAGLSFLLGAGGALVRTIGTLITSLLIGAPGKLGGALGGIAGKLGLVGLAAMGGYEIGDYLLNDLPKKLGAKMGTGDALGSMLYNFFHPEAEKLAAGQGGGVAYGTIVRSPPPTPTAPRPLSAAQQSAAAGQPPTSSTAGPGTQIHIDEINISTRATDADGIAADIGGALKRKLTVANFDSGQG